VAVVISDFEVVVEPPSRASEPASGANAETPTEQVVLTEQEVEMLLARQAERAARVRAH
jgi:hypothetical protein